MLTTFMGVRDDQIANPSVRLDCPLKNHCTNGTCYADAPGSPCNVALDCPPSSGCEKSVCK